MLAYLWSVKMFKKASYAKKCFEIYLVVVSSWQLDQII
jgi:hypothetical protein